MSGAVPADEAAGLALPRGRRELWEYKTIMGWDRSRHRAVDRMPQEHGPVLFHFAREMGVA